MRPSVDWRRLLTEERVAFIERGPNVKRGEINIRCPFCGSADPSYHMGLNLENGWWSCWRNKRSHSGKSPVRLLMALLRVPFWKAREIAGLNNDYIDPEGFSAIAAQVLGFDRLDKPKAAEARSLHFPQTFEPLQNTPRHRLHWRYLEQDRNFGPWVDFLAELYDIQVGAEEWSGRVVLPYHIDGALVAWTGRAIGRSSLRYRDLDVDECLVPIKHTLYNYDAIPAGGKALVIVEGPMDALKIDLFGRSVGVRAVALSTNSLSDEQVYMLFEADDRFEQKLVMMDTADPLDILSSHQMMDQLSLMRGLQAVPVPYGLKDAALMSPRGAIDWANSIVKGTHQ